jgi:hypothetical protein
MAEIKSGCGIFEVDCLSLRIVKADEERNGVDQLSYVLPLPVKLIAGGERCVDAAPGLGGSGSLAVRKLRTSTKRRDHHQERLRTKDDTWIQMRSEMSSSRKVKRGAARHKAN